MYTTIEGKKTPFVVRKSVVWKAGIDTRVVGEQVIKTCQTVAVLTLYTTFEGKTFPVRRSVVWKAGIDTRVVGEQVKNMSKGNCINFVYNL